MNVCVRIPISKQLLMNQNQTFFFGAHILPSCMTDPCCFLLPRNLVCYWSLHATIAPPWYFRLSGTPPRLEPPRGIAGSTGSTRRANWSDIMWYHRSEPFKCLSYVFGTIWITYASYIIHWMEFHHFSRSSKYIQGSIPLNYLKWPRKHFTIPTFTAFICTCLPCISPQLQPVKVRFLASHSTKAAIKLNTTKAPFRRPWRDIFLCCCLWAPRTPTPQHRNFQEAQAAIWQVRFQHDQSQIVQGSFGRVKGVFGYPWRKPAMKEVGHVRELSPQKIP